MRNTFEDILEFNRQKGAAFVDRFMDSYICSIGGHMFNLYNKEAEVYTEGTTAADTRIHIFFIAPPGFSKTYFLRLLLDGKLSVLRDTVVECVMEGTMTEAAFTGTSMIEGGKRVVVPGRAYDYRNHVVGIEEFRDFVQMMTLEYGKNLEGAMLTALDSGWVRKNLATTTRKELKYVTNLTLWVASQPFSVDISSGLARRFIWMYWAPTKSDETVLRKARRRNKNMKPNFELQRHIIKGILERRKKIWEIEEVSFDDELYKWMNGLNVPHYEEMLYERIALGGFLMSEDFGRHVHVTLNDRTRELIRKCDLWRKQIKRGPEIGMVFQLLREKSPQSRSELIKNLSTVGFSYKAGSELVRSMISRRLLKKEKIPNPGGRGPRIEVLTIMD